MNEAFLKVFGNPWVTFAGLVFLCAMAIILLFVYMPRMDELLRLRRIIDRQRKRIKELSEGSTRAEIDHETKLDAIKGEYLSDIGELTSELAAQRGRAKQNASRADQLARAAERRSA